MQCVILCAGKGTRMGDLTASIPKPLIEVCSKPIIEHIVRALPSEIDELVLVVGYLKEQIKEYCGDEYLGRHVTYCNQEDYTGGTGDAFMCAKDVLKGKFLFMYGDDIHGKDAIKKAIEYDHAMLGMESETPERFGVLMQNEDGTLKEIIEKPKIPKSNLVNIGGFVVDDTIFSYEVQLSEVNELYVTDILTAYAKDNPVKIIKQDLWLPIGYPEHIAEAEKVLCPKSD